jgi:hypothetical protein
MKTGIEVPDFDANDYRLFSAQDRGLIRAKE